MSENNAVIIEEDDRNIMQKLDHKYNNILAARFNRFPRFGKTVAVTAVAVVATAAVVMLNVNSKKNHDDSED